jgi:membrane-associated phospholipid phosphatase
MPTDNHAIRRRLALFAAWLAAIGLAIAFVDRPASTWSHAHLHGMACFNWLTYIVNPLMPVASLGLAAAGLAAAFSRWRPGPRALTLIACGVSEVTAFAIKEQLKWIFGRTWPETWTHGNPSWISNHAYGFHFFHGGEGWFSFPSGHMTMITAVAGVLWVRAPRGRWLWALLVGLVALGLWGSDFHFVGDMIAGTGVGWGTSRGVLALGAHLAGRDGPPPAR